MPGAAVQFNLATGTAALLIAGAAPVAAVAQCAETRWDRVAIIGGGFVAAQAAAVALRGDDWWPEPTGRFHFDAQPSPARQQDRLLHAAIGYHTAQLGRIAWRWTCVSDPAAAWLGAALGIAVSLPKEIGDGLQPAKGFDLPDMLYTAAGSVLPAVHRTVPASRAVQLKALYWPSGEYRNRSPGELPQLENDYAGQRYYLTFNPGLLRNGGGAWPDWLGVAVGHSVTSWAVTPPEDEWYVTLDLNARGLPIGAHWWKSLAAFVDQVHLPLPGVKIAGGSVQVGLF